MNTSFITLSPYLLSHSFNISGFCAIICFCSASLKDATHSPAQNACTCFPDCSNIYEDSGSSANHKTPLHLIMFVGKSVANLKRNYS